MPMKPDQRKAIPAETLQGQVAEGACIESQDDFQAVTVTGRRPNKVLHLVLTILTVGLWGLLVWLPIARFGGEKRGMLIVDEDGNVASEKP